MPLVRSQLSLLETDDDLERGPIYSADEIAKVLMVSTNRVYSLFKEGLIPREPSGRFRLIPTVQGYIRYIKKDSGDEDQVSLTQERGKLVKAQREKLEMEMDIIKGKFILAAEVESGVAALVNTITGVLDTMPDRLERDADLKPRQVDMVYGIIESLRGDMYQSVQSFIAEVESKLDVDQQDSVTDEIDNS